MTTPRSTTRRPTTRRRRPARSQPPDSSRPTPAPAAPVDLLGPAVDVDVAPIAFDHLGFPETLMAGIADRGFASTTPVQSAVLPLIREGHDVVACAETGTGKTAAFVLPILERLLQAARGGEQVMAGRTRVLVLTPTRELAVQIDDDIQGFAYHAGVSSIAVYGGVPMDMQTRALEAGVPIVVATPGRLMDHMRSGTVSFTGLEVLVLDEADRMLDMGFWPDVRRIVSEVPAERQTLLFSATMPHEIAQFALAIMREPKLVEAGQRNRAARTIRHAVEPVPSRDKADWLARFLRRADGPVLIFVRTKIGADRLTERLRAKGLRAAALHADRSQKDRLSAVEGFKGGRFRALVATDIAARGLDIDGITWVVNYDVPHSYEAYVHRVGRTGRALASGTALTLVSPEEEELLRPIKELVGRPRLADLAPSDVDAVESDESGPSAEGSASAAE